MKDIVFWLSGATLAFLLTAGAFLVLANLATTPVRPGLVAVAAVLFGSTAFDSFKDSTRWVKFVQGDFVSEHSWAPQLVTNAGLLGFVLLVA